MMSIEHPITPPPELVREWQREANHNEAMFPQVAALAAQWGADQELEACCEWLKKGWDDVRADKIRAARRPKPPSLKERALQAWTAVEAGTDDQTAMAVIRRALEALTDD